MTYARSRAVFVGVLIACVLIACVAAAKGPAGGGARRVERIRYSAPVLRVSGVTLTWSAIRGAKRYAVATVRPRSTTRETTYRTVIGTQFTPGLMPGQTVNYGVKADLPNAPWSTEVTIRWPRARRVIRAGRKLRVAVNAITYSNADAVFRQIGVVWERLDIHDGQDSVRCAGRSAMAFMSSRSSPRERMEACKG